MEKENNKKETTGVFKKILNILGNAVLIVLIAIGILIAFSLVPVKGNYQVMSVMSGSMEPTIPVGSLIVVKPSSSYEVGDIITFLPMNAKTKKENITHRIFSIKQENGNKLFETKGDANKSPDEELITQDRIIGKHLFTVALLGYVLTYIKTLPGLLFIVLIPSVIIIYEEMKKIKNEAKNAIQKRRERIRAKTGEKNQSKKKIKKATNVSSKVSKRNKNDKKKGG